MGSKKEQLYNALPYPLKFLLLNIKGYLNTKQRYNKQFKAFLKQHKVLWTSNIQEVEAFQEQRLKILLSEVYVHSKYYSEVMKKEGVTLLDIDKKPRAVLHKMPLLTKRDRKAKVEQLLNNKRTTAMIGHTSGTSGSPTVDYIDRESINASFAIWKRFHYSIGILPKNRQVRFSGRLVVDTNKHSPPFWVYNYFENQLLMSTYHLTSDNLKHYIKKLNTFKPVLLDGYPSAIYIISQYINKNNVSLTFSPKAIAVTAETLYDYQRQEIEKAFNCKVYNQYASNEGSPFITECNHGNLHLNLDSGVFEFINLEGKKANPGELAKLVVTSFINYRTPLIRYSIEDTVLLPKEQVVCSCGCQMPIVENIIGREDDILFTEEKGYVGRLTTAYKGLDGIINGQIIQETPDLVVVNLIVDDNFNSKIQAQFLYNIKSRLGNKINIKINIVNQIALGANGKFDAVKRNFELDIN